MVIGILIALQVDNWNEERKLRQLEISYLEKLIEEIEFNENSFEMKVEYYTVFVDSQKKLLALFQRGISFDESEMLFAIEMCGEDEGIWIKKDIWNDLNSTGNIQIIQNRELLQRISQFYTTLNVAETIVHRDVQHYRSNFKKLTNILIPPETRVRITTIIKSYSDSLILNIPDKVKGLDFGIKEELDIAEIIRRFRSDDRTGAALADLQILTQGIIPFFEFNVKDDYSGTQSLISAIKDELNRLKN